MSQSKVKKVTTKPSTAQSPRLYTLKVSLTDGPTTEVHSGQEISRTIQIFGHQTLHDLHKAIFKAFERSEAHLYEFILGKGPRDRSKRFVHRGGWDSGAAEAGDPEATRLDALKLRVGRRFGYIFDMGDHWEHTVEVLAVEGGSTRGKSPRIIEKVGASPPQYPHTEDWESC